MTLRPYLDFQEPTTSIVRTKLHIMTIVLFFRIFRRRFTITEEPYFVEMLLFLAAPGNIIDDIKSSVTVTIRGKENNMINT